MVKKKNSWLRYFRDLLEQSQQDAIVESLNQSMRRYLDTMVLSIVNQVKSQLLPEMTSRLERIDNNLTNNLKSQKQQSDETLVKLYKNQVNKYLLQLFA